VTGVPVDDALLWRTLTATIDDVVIPALPPGHALDTAVQLTGLARYAASRPAADPDGRARRLREALGSAAGPATATALEAVLLEASQVLVGAIRGADPEGVAAKVRAMLLDQLDEDIRIAAPLLETFSGHPATDVEPVERGVPAGELDRLVRWFSDVHGGPVGVERAIVISGGHSRRMLRIDLHTPAGPAAYVVRIEQGGTFGTDGTLEAGACARWRRQASRWPRSGGSMDRRYSAGRSS